MRIRWFLLIYFVYLLSITNFNYLDSDQASHAMNGVLIKRLMIDLINYPTINPIKIMNYVKAYYVHYPKFVLNYGPVYPLINSLLAPHQSLMKLAVITASVINLLFIYKVLKRFNEQLAIIAMLVTATGSVYIHYSTMLMPNIISVLLFTMGVYYYYERKQIISGLLLGLSVMAKEFSIVFVTAFIIVGLGRKKKLLITIILTLTPYLLLLLITGGIKVLLAYPVKQAWYGLRDNDPQWYSISGWYYFFKALMINHTIIGLLLFITGWYYYRKKDYSIITLITYLAIVLLSDKAPQRLLYGSVFYSAIIGRGLMRLRNKWLLIILFSLMVSLSLPARQAITDPVSDLANDLVTECPNCTVLIASETGSVYSSSIMYEALIRDANVTMRFLRPSSFTDLNVTGLVNNELINRIIIIGDDYGDYEAQCEYVINHYPIVHVYNSSLAGLIRVYDTGVTGSKGPPYCFKSVATNITVCSDYASPLEALKK